MICAEVVTLCANVVMAVFAVVAGVCAWVGAYCAVKGLGAYKDAKLKEATERADNAYTKASDAYLAYLKLCIEYPEAQPWRMDDEKEGSNLEYQRFIIYSFLIRAMETAFIQYNQPDVAASRKVQWDEGWAEYIDASLMDEPFRKTWGQVGPQYDKRFVAYMDGRSKALGLTDSAAA